MSDFELSRSTRIAAPRERVHALVDDFTHWRTWSPWEGVDPDLRRTYSGPEQGVGAEYSWSGNRKAGEGHMRITESQPERVAVDLEFLKPFRAANVIVFRLDHAGPPESTDVTWTMTGSRNPVMALMGRLFFDQAIGGDFDRGLAALKREAERG